MTHLISWNVAGWGTTLDKIRLHHGSFQTWLSSHDCDIICLQEVKTTFSKLENDPPERLACKEQGFDGFFAPCGGKEKIGFNGVATFAKKGKTLRADRKPFRDALLDEEGRCLVTYHGDFVLFNVYVPYDGNGKENLPLKMEFLIRLRKKMNEVREMEKKPVILVGDMNANYRLLDKPAGWRLVDLKRLVESVPLRGEPAFATRIREAFANGGLETLRVALAGLETEPFGPKNKFRVFARHPLTGEKKRLNPSALWTQEEVNGFKPFCYSARDAMRVDSHVLEFARTTTRSGRAVAEIGEDGQDVKWIVREGGFSLHVSALQIYAKELFDVKYTQEEIEEFALYVSGGWLDGGTCAAPQAWLEQLVDCEGMIDTFTQRHPMSRDRFTIWNQQTNERYVNAGSRLDFIFIDPTLSIAKHDPLPLYGCDCPNKPRDCERLGYKCADDGASAARAATAYGRWKQAPFEGGGLPEGSQAAYDSQFRSRPGTGIIYTPPDFSDHVAVTCALDQLSPEFMRGELKLGTDPETRSCNPAMKQRSIMDMFGGAMQKKPKTG